MKKGLEMASRWGEAFDVGCRMDWSGCELVEVIPGKVSGVPLLKGTRLPVDVILDSYDFGSSIEELTENYPSASIETIKALIAYADSKESPPRPIYYTPPGEDLSFSSLADWQAYEEQKKQNSYGNGNLERQK